LNLMYLNAAWWCFSLLFQFYLIFPLLFLMPRHVGPLWFLFIACAVGFFARYMLLVVWQQNGLWVLGGFAICRLPEFALGMSLAMWHTRSPARVDWFFLRGGGLVLGLILYPAALQLYDGLYEYAFVDFATGACCMLEIVGIAGIISLFKGPANLFGLVGLYSYGLYLIHQPYVIWLGLRIREMPIWAFLLMRLRNQFSEEQLMQLAAQIAFENCRARWNRLFNVESDHLIMDRRRRSVAMRYGRAGASQVCLNLS